MRVCSLPKTDSLAPVEQTGADDRHLYYWMQVEAIDKRWRRDRGVATRHTGQAGFTTNINWQISNPSGRKTDFHRWKLSQHDCRFIRKKHAVPRKFEIGAHVRF